MATRRRRRKVGSTRRRKRSSGVTCRMERAPGGGRRKVCRNSKGRFVKTGRR